MKSQVFILLVGIVLLEVSLSSAEGEEATKVPGAEPSPLNSTGTNSSASVPPSPKEADEYNWNLYQYLTPREICDSFEDFKDSNYKCTDTYREYTQYTDPERKSGGRCIRIYHEDFKQFYSKFIKCLAEKCIAWNQPDCNLNCQKEVDRSIKNPCGDSGELSGGAIAGIIIGVLVLLAVIVIAGVCLCLKRKKRGAVNPVGQPLENLWQPSAAPSAYVNQPPPAFANQPGPPAYANQPPTGPPGYANQPGPSAYANQPGPSAYANQPGPPVYANQPGPPVYANQPGPPVYGNQQGPPAYANQPGPPTYANQPGPPAYANQPGPPVYANQPGPPVYANQPGPPAYANQPSAAPNV